MLYNEFVEGTGCRENDHNYQLYKDLEVIYMKYDGMTKEDVYRIGKKLADNSPSEKELQLRAEIEAKKEMLVFSIADYERKIGEEKALLVTETESFWRNHRRSLIKEYQQQARSCRAELKTLNHFFK